MKLADIIIFLVERSNLDQNSYVNNTRILTEINTFIFLLVTLQLVYFDIRKTVYELVSNHISKF